jgi:hypothetical protein
MTRYVPYINNSLMWCSTTKSMIPVSLALSAKYSTSPGINYFMGCGWHPPHSLPQTSKILTRFYVALLATAQRPVTRRNSTNVHSLHFNRSPFHNLANSETTHTLGKNCHSARIGLVLEWIWASPNRYREYHAHKAVLCMESEYFLNTFTGGFKVSALPRNPASTFTQRYWRTDMNKRSFCGKTR